MDSSVITACSFRSGGATSAIEHGADHNQVMKIGRWKTTDIFYNNYVAACPKNDLTDRMLGVLEKPVSVSTPLVSPIQKVHESDDQSDEHNSSSILPSELPSPYSTTIGRKLNFSDHAAIYKIPQRKSQQ